MTRVFHSTELGLSEAGVACAMAVANALIPGGEKMSGFITGDTLIGETSIGEAIICEAIISLIGAG